MRAQVILPLDQATNRPVRPQERDLLRAIRDSLQVDVDGELAEVVPMEVVLVVLDLVKDLIDSSQRSESLGGKA